MEITAEFIAKKRYDNTIKRAGNEHFPTWEDSDVKDYWISEAESIADIYNNDNKILVSFYHDFGRSGDVEGLFVTTREQLAEAMGQDAALGEILGKHSDVTVTVTEENTKIVSDDNDKIKWLMEIIGYTATISGYNVVDYAIIHDEDEEEEDEEYEDEEDFV
jgi:hypothetical protein